MSRIASVIIALLFTATIASAAVVESYAVSDYSGPPGGHGLYMNTSQYYFETGAYFERYSNGTGKLIGTAKTSDGSAGFDVSLSFGNFRTWTQQDDADLDGKIENGGNNKTEWTYMDLVGPSTLTDINDANTVYNLIMKPISGPYTFQYGEGANAKQAGVLGLAGWFYTDGGNGSPGSPCGSNSTCDFNLKLTSVPTNTFTTPVPIPAGMALLPVGLGMLAAMRRRKRRETV